MNAPDSRPPLQRAEELLREADPAVREVRVRRQPDLLVKSAT